MGTRGAILRLFEHMGYAECASHVLEGGYEKVALYCKDVEPQHVAWQLGSGSWTSKLGRFVDIEHELSALQGQQYGTVAHVMKRPRASLTAQVRSE